MNERALQDAVIAAVARPWLLIAREFDVVTGFAQFGRGDLLFGDVCTGQLLVIETKMHSASKAREQARRYASWVCARAGAPVAYATTVGRLGNTRVHGVVHPAESGHVVIEAIKAQFLTTGLPTRSYDALISALRCLVVPPREYLYAYGKLARLEAAPARAKRRDGACVPPARHKRFRAA